MGLRDFLRRRSQQAPPGIKLSRIRAADTPRDARERPGLEQQLLDLMDEYVALLAENYELAHQGQTGRLDQQLLWARTTWLINQDEDERFNHGMGVRNAIARGERFKISMGTLRFHVTHLQITVPRLRQAMVDIRIKRNRKLDKRISETED